MERHKCVFCFVNIRKMLQRLHEVYKASIRRSRRSHGTHAVDARSGRTERAHGAHIALSARIQFAHGAQTAYGAHIALSARIQLTHGAQSALTYLSNQSNSSTVVEDTTALTQRPLFVCM